MKKFVVCVLLILAGTSLLAQEKKTMGLVLSGGGAKGLAHIGVLKALEEEGIGIDYISGTSMGAIVGGLYASGYSPQQIEDLFFAKDFDSWLSGNIDKRLLPYYTIRKKDASILKVGFNIDKKFKAELPLSLVDPVQMDFAFLDIFAGANKVCNSKFDSLMIPYFCVATNINDNNSTTYRKGDLGHSIRASMSFPFFFTPIQIDGKLMCDGGIYNNFPAKEMIDFYNPDMVLGVKVANNFDAPQEDDLILYIENMVSSDSDYKIDAENSLLLEPDMSDIGIMNFGNKEECIQRGYDITKRNIEKIKQRLQDTVSQEYINSRREDFAKKKGSVMLSRIYISGVEKDKKQYFIHLLERNLPEDDAIPMEKIKDNYLSLCSDPNVKKVEPYLFYDEDNDNYILRLDITMKRTLDFKIGGILSSDPISNLFVGADFNSISYVAWRHKTNFYLGRYYSSFMYNLRMDVPNRALPFYLETEINYNRWNYFRNRSALFEYSATNYIVQRENNVLLKCGIASSRRGRLVAKVGYGFVDDEFFMNDVILNTDTNDHTTFPHYTVALLGEHNTLDNSLFPMEGSQTMFRIHYVQGHEKFYAGNFSTTKSQYAQNHYWIQGKLEGKFYKKFTDRFSLGSATELFISTQDLFYTRKASLLNAGIYTPTIETLTGFYPEYRANQYLAEGLEGVYSFGSNFLGDISVRLGAYAFLPARRIIADNKNLAVYSDWFDKIYGILSAKLVISTPLGVLSTGVSYHQRENNASPWNFNISFGTLIFNSKNIDR